MRKLHALVLFALVATSSVALAQKAPRSGTVTRTWAAKGVKFTHETTRMFGNVVHWQRRATQKDGTTRVTGVTWNNRARGLVEPSEVYDGSTIETMVYHGHGETRVVRTLRDGQGKDRMSVIAFQDGRRRVIVTDEKGQKSTLDLPSVLERLTDR